MLHLNLITRKQTNPNLGPFCKTIDSGFFKNVSVREKEEDREGRLKEEEGRDQE